MSDDGEQMPADYRRRKGGGRLEEESVPFVTSSSSSSLMQQSADGQRQDLTTEALSSAVVKDENPKMPLAALFHLKKQKQKRKDGAEQKKMLNTPLSVIHRVFSFRSQLFFFFSSPHSPSHQSHKTRSVHASCVTAPLSPSVGVARWITGQI